MELREFGRRKLSGLSVFLGITAAICLLAGIAGAVLYFATSNYKTLGWICFIGGLALFLVAIFLLVLTRIQAKKYTYAGTIQERIDSLYVHGSGQVVYCTYDGQPLTRVQYDALCLLMDECRKGNISKKQYARAKAYILRTK